MNIADDVVDILFVDHYFGVSALYEPCFELFDIDILGHGHYFGSRFHAVAHLEFREVERILEYFHLVVDIRALWRILDAALQEEVEVDLAEGTVAAAVDHFHAHQPEQQSGEEGGES